MASILLNGRTIELTSASLIILDESTGGTRKAWFPTPSDVQMELFARLTMDAMTSDERVTEVKLLHDGTTVLWRDTQIDQVLAHLTGLCYMA